MTGPEKVTMRKGAPEDAAMLSAFGKRTFLETWKDTASEENLLAYVNESYDEQKVVEELASPDYYYVMLEREKQLLGFAKLEDAQSPPAEIARYRCIEINKLYLDAPFKGKGLGKVIMYECIRIARQRKMECIFLGVWEENVRAVKLYSKFGFSSFGRHPFVMGTQTDWDTWMKKML